MSWVQTRSLPPKPCLSQNGDSKSSGRRLGANAGWAAKWWQDFHWEYGWASCSSSVCKDRVIIVRWTQESDDHYTNVLYNACYNYHFVNELLPWHTQTYARVQVFAFTYFSNSWATCKALQRHMPRLTLRMRHLRGVCGLGRALNFTVFRFQMFLLKIVGRIIITR